MSVTRDEVRHGNTLLIPVKGHGMQKVMLGDVSNGVALCVLLDIEDSDFFTLPVEEIMQHAEPSKETP